MRKQEPTGSALADADVREAAAAYASLRAATAEAALDASPAELIAMLGEGLASLRGVTLQADPQAQFTDAELSELAEGGFDLSPLPEGRGDPRARAAVLHARMLAGALTVPRAAKRLGVDESRIRQRLKEGTLYGLKVAGGEWRLPSFQFAGRGLLPGIQIVLRALPHDLHPVAVLGWFVTPVADLAVDGKPCSPRDWLATGGDPERAARLAAEL